MRLVHRWEFGWVFVATLANTDTVLPVGDYVKQDPTGTKARAWIEVRGKQGNGSFAAGVTQSNDITGAGTTTRLCAFATADGVGNPDATATTLDPVPTKYIRPCAVIK